MIFHLQAAFGGYRKYLEDPGPAGVFLLVAIGCYRVEAGTDDGTGDGIGVGLGLAFWLIPSGGFGFDGIGDGESVAGCGFSRICRLTVSGRLKGGWNVV